MDTSIAALSVEMHMAQTQQAFDVAVLKTAMETEPEMVAEDLQELVNLDPYLGHNLDVLA